MLYDSYVSQVKKAARIKDKIIKYKLPIFIVIGAIFAFWIFFISTKGIVLGDVELPNHFVYGEDITPDSSAMFSGVSFEYRAVGEELWSSEVPTTPGEYEVRATSKRAFGGKGHSKPQLFVIEPLSCDVKAISSSITYGENPEVSSDSLLKGHHIECTSFIYDDVSLNSTSVKPDLKYTHIYDETGADVTDCYSLNAISSDITFNKRSLEITIDSSTKIYDGMILKNNQYQITSGSLAFDDRIEIVIEKYIINAGKIDNVESSYRILNGSKESTINYDVKIIPGYLQIDKRPIVITSDNQTITYDGNTHSSTYTYSGNLITGHSFEFVSNTTVLNVGTYSNDLKLRIVDSEGNDVTSNYELTYIYGKIEILKRDLHVKMLNQSKIYDNLALTSNAYELQDGELVETHDISVTGLASIIDVGTISNGANVKISSNGLDVTANYNIIIEEGTLEVTPRAISIKPCDISVIYDGEYHRPNDFEYIDSNITLFEGESFVLTYSEAYKYADSYKSKIESYKILRNNEEDITKNYDVTLTEGIIEILVRNISVKPEDIEVVYDNQYHQASSFKYVNDSLELIQTDGITFIYSEGYRDCPGGESQIIEINFQNEAAKNSYEFTTLTGSIKILKRDIKVKPKDLEITYDSFDHVSSEAIIENINDHELLGKITVSIKTDGIVNEYTETPVINSITNCFIYDGEEEITDNFNIILNTGTLNVLKRPLKVIAGSASKVYDNKVLTLNEYTLEGEIASNDEISSIVIEGEILDVGKVGNTIKEFIIIRSNTSHEVTPSYDITYVDGTLEVTPRPISIKPCDIRALYDGEYHGPNTFEYIDSSITLFDGESFVLSYSEGYKYAGTYKSKIESYKILRNNKEDITNNYDVTLVEGNVEILVRTIKVRPTYVEAVYDNEYHASSSFEYLDVGYKLIPSDGITFIYNEGYRDCPGGESQILEIRFQNEEARSSYKFDTQTNEIKITPRTISIKPCDISVIYDGEYHRPNDFEYIDPNITLFAGESFVLTYSEAYKYAGTYKSKIESYKILRNNEDDITKNYNVTLAEGDIEILVRNISVKPEDIEVVYDNQYHQASSFKYVNDSLELIQTDGITFIYSEGYRDCPGGESQIIEINFQNEAAKNSYEFTTLTGSIKILKRDIKIVLEDATKVYDGIIFTSNKYHLDNNYYDICMGQILNFDTYTMLDGVEIDALDVNIYTNAVKNIKITSDNQDVTSNYNVYVENGTLEIVKRKIEIQTESNQKTYDDISKSYPNSVVTSNFDKAIVDGEVLHLEYESFRDVGRYQNIPTTIKILRNNKDISKLDYDITWVYGVIEIVARNVTITTESKSWSYDASLHTWEKFDASNLVSGHKISGTLFASIKHYGTVDNSFTPIVLSDHGDVTKNYEFSWNYGTLKVTGISIEVTTEDAKKEYDGTPLKSTLEQPNITLGSLKDKDIASIKEETKSSITYYQDGGIKNTYEIYISNSDGEDLINLGDYSVTYKYGTLEITKREIKVSPGNILKEYNGFEQMVRDLVVISDKKLAQGDAFKDVITSNKKTYVSQNDEENINKIISFKIYANSYDITDSYAVSLEGGTFKIVPRELVIKTGSSSKPYDGLPLTNENYDIVEGLVSSDYIIGRTTGYIVEPGSVVNSFVFNAYNQNGDDITSSYALSDKQFGKLEIAIIDEDKVLFKIKTSINDTVYLKASSYGDYQGSDHFLSSKKYDLFDEDKFVALALKDNQYNLQTLEYIDNSYSMMPYYTLSNNQNVYSYYSYDYVMNPNIVRSSFVEVEKAYRSFVYENYLQIDEETKSFMKTIQETNELAGLSTYEKIARVKDIVSTKVPYNLNYDVNFNDSNVNTAIYFFNGAQSAICRHYATAATMLLRSMGIPARYTTGYMVDTVANTETEVYASYGHAWVEVYVDNLGWINLEVTGSSSNPPIVVPKPSLDDWIRIKLTNLSFEYDGNYHGRSATDFELDSISSEKYYVTLDEPFNTYLNVGKYNDKIDLSQVHVYDKVTKEEVTASVKDRIVLYGGQVIITPHKLEIISGSASKNYDGEELRCEEYTETGLLPGHELKITFTGSQIEPGRSENKFLYEILDNEGKDVSSLYNVTCKYGTLVVYKEIVVQTGTKEEEYQGQTISSNEYKLVDSKLLDGDHIEVIEDSLTKLSEYGKVDNIFEARILDKNDNDVTADYKINYKYGHLKLYKKIILESASAKKEYDGTPLTCHELRNEPEIIPSHRLILKFTAEIINCGSVDNIFEYQIIDTLGNDVTDIYYNVETKLGKLEISKYKITITSGSAKKEYDGTPLVCNTGSYELAVDLSFKINVLYGCTSKLILPDTINNKFEPTIYDEFGQDITKQFEIEKKYGTLTVTRTKEEIIVKASNSSKAYTGQTINVNKLYKISGADLSGYQYEVKVVSNKEPIEIGTYKLTPEIRIYKNIDGEYVDVTDKLFAITIIEGTLTINPVKLKITTNSLKMAYNGSEIAKELYQGYSINGKIIAGHTLDVSWSDITVLEYGTYKNSASFKVLDSEGNDVTKYYNITIVFGTIEIIK